MHSCYILLPIMLSIRSVSNSATRRFASNFFSAIQELSDEGYPAHLIWYSMLQENRYFEENSDNFFASRIGSNTKIDIYYKYIPFLPNTPIQNRLDLKLFTTHISMCSIKYLFFRFDVIVRSIAMHKRNWNNQWRFDDSKSCIALNAREVSSIVVL